MPPSPARRANVLRAMGESAASTSYPPENEFDTKPHEQFSLRRQEEKRPRPALSRTCSSVTRPTCSSVARSSSTSTLTRTLSMRKSTSVREGGYRRIHDGLTGDEEDHEADHADEGDHDHDHDDKEGEEQPQSGQKAKGSSGKKKGKLRRACKKLFGF